jgi:hypothetical protein
VVLVGGFALLAPRQSFGQATDVNVVNTPTVNSQQGGDWVVGITGTPPVQVANTDPIPVHETGVPSVTVANTAPIPVSVTQPAANRTFSIPVQSLPAGSTYTFLGAFLSEPRC